MFGEICQIVEDFNGFVILVASDSFMICDSNLCWVLQLVKIFQSNFFYLLPSIVKVVKSVRLWWAKLVTKTIFSGKTK